jgi:hypothetical protein
MEQIKVSSAMEGLDEPPRAWRHSLPGMMLDFQIRDG